MKTEEIDMVNDHSVAFTHTVQCIKNKQSIAVCINKNCLNNPFTCADKICECQSLHKDCLNTEL